MYAGRIPAIENSKLNVNPDMTREQMNAVIPRSVQWKAENYNHLHEQPTYYLAIILALMHLQAKDSVTVGLAWGYVITRVVHSLVHSTKNPIMVRFSIFSVSSAFLAGLIARTAVFLM